MSQTPHKGRHDEVAKLYAEFGQRKPMGQPAIDPDRPHYFLLRRFLDDLDLLIILNTKRCRYRCKFCNLPAKSSPTPIAEDHIVEQFIHVCREVQHALSLLDRITLSNEGSVLDPDTLPLAAMEEIVLAAAQVRSVRTLVLETRLEFLDAQILNRLQETAPRLRVDVLTGFETLNERIRSTFLAKGESIQQFEQGLDRVAAAGVSLTCFVLLKPDPTMSDAEAVTEAEASIAYLYEQAARRTIPLTIRLNAMYSAQGTPWAAAAVEAGGFVPPRLTDALSIATRARNRGIRVYLGLSDEGLASSDGTYMAREDFSRELLRKAKQFNDTRSQADHTR